MLEITFLFHNAGMTIQTNRWISPLLKKKKKKKNYMLKVFFAASKSNSTKRLPKNQYSYHAILMTDVLSLGHTKSEFRHYP